MLPGGGDLIRRVGWLSILANIFSARYTKFVHPSSALSCTWCNYYWPKANKKYFNCTWCSYLGENGGKTGVFSVLVARNAIKSEMCSGFPYLVARNAIKAQRKHTTDRQRRYTLISFAAFARLLHPLGVFLKFSS
jgi:hypothetical protein